MNLDVEYTHLRFTCPGYGDILLDPREYVILTGTARECPDEWLGRIIRFGWSDEGLVIGDPDIPYDGS